MNILRKLAGLEDVESILIDKKEVRRSSKKLTNNTGEKQRSILKNLGWALAATPMVLFIGLIVITLVGAIDHIITIIQLAGYWWLLLIIAYILSLIYFLCESRIRKNIKRKRIVNALILYWKEQLEKQGKNQPTEEEIELVQDMLLERFKIWAWFNPDLWAQYYPNEKYSTTLFGIIDNFMIYWQRQKDKYRH